jgi:hypothetical protein
MAVRLPALHDGHPLSPRFMVLIKLIKAKSILGLQYGWKDWVNLKSKMTSEIEPGSFQGRRMHGCGEALLPYRNATNIFLQISKNVSYFKILINLRTYITYNENIYQDISVIFMLDIGL